MRPATLAPALALSLALPWASAHVESYSQAKALEAGPYLVFFDIQPQPPFAESSVSLVAQLSLASTGAPPRPSPPTSILVAGPGGFSERKTMENDGTGYLVSSMVLPERGMYSARIFVREPASNETHGVDTEFEVFPNIPYRIRPVDQAADVLTGERVSLAFELVDPTTLAPKDVRDLTVKLEHWSDDHTTFLGEQTEATTKVSPAVFRIDPVFAESGMYHIRFASDAGGFNYADVPLLHIYALSPTGAGVQKDTPAAAGALALVGIAIVALALRRSR